MYGILQLRRITQKALIELQKTILKNDCGATDQLRANYSSPRSNIYTMQNNDLH